MAGGNLILQSAPSWQNYKGYTRGVKTKQRRRIYIKTKKMPARNFKQKVLNVIQKVSEKKKITYSNTTGLLSVGQVYANTDGWQCIDLSPIPSQGTGINGRLGSEITLHSGNLRIQFVQMSGTYSPIRFKYSLVWVKGGDQSITTTQFMNQFLNVNPFSVHRDYNSSRNADYMSAFRVLRTGYSYLPADPGSQISQLTVKEARLGMKFKKPLNIRFNGNLNTTAQGKIFLVILADVGNNSTTTANTEATIPVKEINTGASYNYLIDWYYTDL